MVGAQHGWVPMACPYGRGHLVGTYGADAIGDTNDINGNGDSGGSGGAGELPASTSAGAAAAAWETAGATSGEYHSADTAAVAGSSASKRT